MHQTCTQNYHKSTKTVIRQKSEFGVDIHLGSYLQFGSYLWFATFRLKLDFHIHRHSRPFDRLCSDEKAELSGAADK